ncbi:MAG: hypothetical protein Fues2KO_27640 [Fuerstiella sp.]
MSNIRNPTAFEDIQELCREYRRNLRKGDMVQLEDYLSRVDQTSREMLFQNLLHIDIEYQRRQGGQPCSDDYTRRFPEHRALIRQAFFESTLMSADPSLQTPAADRTELEDVPAGRKLGDYELLRQIGRGAFGAVYKAKHLQRGDVVALKLLPLNVDGRADGSGEADRLHKFRREFRALSDVNHPNLVGMQSLEVDGRQWFFTMDLIDGTDFLDYVRPQGRLNMQRLRSALPQLAEGIAALHRRQVVHRDLKPANVMVNHDGLVSVLDFGLVIEERARVDFTVLVSKHGFAGTPQYAAPEQMFGDCETASDWYSFGVMLFEALTGRLPFCGSAAEVMRAKSSADAQELSIQASIPKDLARLTDQLLQRDPDRRPDAEAILAMLSGSVEDLSSDAAESVSRDSTSDSSRASLVGREHELQQLLDVHRQLCEQGEPQAVFIRGRSGEGKTSLADEFLSLLNSRFSCLVFSGRCYDRESVPFKAVDAVIDSLVLFLRSQDQDDVRQWLPEDIQPLAQLFPTLRRVEAIGELPRRSADVEDNRQLRHRGFAAFRDLLVTIGRRVPVILFIDDLQWGDADSAAALRDVLQPPQAPRVLLLGTYRSDEAADSPFLQEWADASPLSDEHLEEHTVDVGPLSQDECLKLLAVRLGTDPQSVQQQAAKLFGDTQGNPYFLDQLLEGLDPATGTVEAVPLAELIERRLSRLPPAARPLLNAIAVAGQAVDLTEAATIADDQTLAMSIITHMRNERLVRLIGSTDEGLVDTYHDKVRETVLAGLLPEERRTLHLAFAEMLIRQEQLSVEAVLDLLDRLHSDEQLSQAQSASTERVFDIAHHLSLAEDSRTFYFQLLAGALSVAAFSMDTAVEHLKLAESLRPPDLDDITSFRLSFLRAKATAGCDRGEEAIAHYDDALQKSPSNAHTAECLFAQSTLYWGRSEYDMAQNVAHRAFVLLGEGVPSTLIGRLLATGFAFAQVHFLPTAFSGRLRHMPQKELVALSGFYTIGTMTIGQFDALIFLYLTVRNWAIARHTGCQMTQAEASASYGGTLRLIGVPWFPKGRMRQAELLEQQLPASQRTGISDFYRGAYHYSSGRFTDALDAFRVCIARMSRCRHYSLNYGYHFSWHTYSHLGPTGPLLENAIEEFRIAQRQGDRLLLAYARYGMAEGIAKRGDSATGLRLARAAVESLTPLRPMVLSVALVQQARVQIQGGNYEGARDSAGHAIREVFRLNILEISVPAFALHAEATLGLNWIANRRQLDRRSVRRANLSSWTARRIGWLFPTARPAAFRASGRVAAAAGRTWKARRFFDRAISAAERMDARYELARALIDRSLLDGPEAAKDRRRGLAILDEIQCVLPLAEQAQLGLPNQPARGVDPAADLHAIRHALPESVRSNPI